MEIRDPIYGFITLYQIEWDLINTFEFQRLRYIHQLGPTFWIYPSATHTRFEHSLGVLEIASRIFDTITRKQELNKIYKFKKQEIKIDKIRELLRISALFHDLGHLPFSHASEELFENGLNYEKYTIKILEESEKIKEIIEIKNSEYGIKIKDIIDVLSLTIKTKEIPDVPKYYYLIKELITGELGSDRIDYLIRDSHHLGVSYGKFDIYRLIDTFKLVENPANKVFDLGIEEGGIGAAEGLILARYFMFNQVYFHEVRRIYDLHLTDYLKNILTPTGKFSSKVQEFLKWNDFKILYYILDDYYKDNNNVRKEMSKIFFERNHFRKIDELRGSQLKKKQEFEKIKNDIKNNFGTNNCKFDVSSKAPYEYKEPEFLVEEENGSVIPIREKSDLIKELKPILIERIYCKNDGNLKNKIKKFWEKERGRLI